MLTTGMDMGEVMAEVMTDVKSVEAWMIMQSRAQAQEWARVYKYKRHTFIKEWRSPRRNVWTVATSVGDLQITENGIVPPEPTSLYWTTMQTEEGTYVFWPKVSVQEGMILFVLQPHLFQRYRERFLKDPSVKMPRVIREFILRNSWGQMELDPKDHTRWRIHLPDGIMLGNYLDGAGRMGRTFITRDMLRDEEVFQQTQEHMSMQQLHERAGKYIHSIKDTAASAEEAKRITEIDAESHRKEDYKRRERQRRKESKTKGDVPPPPAKKKKRKKK